MDHANILKRSWTIMWEYRALWIFGVLLALSGGSNFSGVNNSINYRSSSNRGFKFPGTQEFSRQLDQLSRQLKGAITPQFWNTVMWVVLAVIIFFLLLSILFAIGRYVSQVAIIRMVDEHENLQKKVGWKEGFRMGWSRSAWRLFLINLLIFAPLIVIVLLLFGCAAIPAIVGSTAGKSIATFGVIATIGLIFPVIFLIIILNVAISLFIEMINRECVLQEAGVTASIRQGWDIVHRNFMNILGLWLILVGIRIAYFIASIPIALLLMGVGALLGGGIGVTLHAILQAIAGSSSGWAPAAIVGSLIFIIVVGLPLLFLGGLRETYLSTTWTLAYRQLTPTIPLAMPGAAESNPATPAA